MDDIRVRRTGASFVVELPDSREVKVNARCAEESAEELRIDTENVAAIKAIIQEVDTNITWGEFTEMLIPIIRVVSPELLISHLLEQPDYIIRDADALLESVLDEFTGQYE